MKKLLVKIFATFDILELFSEVGFAYIFISLFSDLYYLTLPLWFAKLYLNAYQTWFTSNTSQPFKRILKTE